MLPPIDVSATGAVHLGPRVVCDGFAFDAKVRVQSHIHVDHMDSFEASKGFQDLVMSEPTREFLVAERNADIPYRENIKTMELGTSREFGGDCLTLLHSGHMLGAVQTCVELPDGTRVGYSGDFRWPLTAVIEVDGLVVDSTYGSPDHVREYSQADVDGRFIELVVGLVKRGPLYIKAHRGTLQRALELLAGLVDVPIVASPSICREIAVYRKWGYCLEPTISAAVDKSVGHSKGRHIKVYGSMEAWPPDDGFSSKVVLSAFSVGPKDPVAAYSDRSFRVAMSDHADFNGTLEYVAATGASYVITDAVRGANAAALATELSHRLGVTALPSSSRASPEWGS